MGDRNLGVANRSGNLGQRGFVLLAIAIRMHQDNRHRAQALIVGGLHTPAGTRDIERPQDFSRSVDTLINLKYVAIE